MAMTYTYQCENGHITEIKLNISEDKPKTVECSVCGKESKRVFNTANIVYKGTGWYSTSITRGEQVVENTSI